MRLEVIDALRRVCTFSLMILLALVLTVGVMGGCGIVEKASQYVDFAVCYVHPEYGKVCVEFDGKLHFSADVQNDPLKLAEVTEWLKSKGVKIPESQ